MSALSNLRRAIGAAAVRQYARHLERKGSVTKALTCALVQVEASQIELFQGQAQMLSEVFDKVLAVWPVDHAPSRLPKNVELFLPESGISSRWELLRECTDCFVCPISLTKPIQKSHVTHLKKHLFSVGGANAVALHNFRAHQTVVDGQPESAAALIPVPMIDPDYAIFDQRFWGLRGNVIDASDSAEAFASEAHRRSFGLYACNDALAESRLKRGARQSYSRFDLVETALRAPKVIQKLTPEMLQLWIKAWDSLGVQGENASSAEISQELLSQLEKNEAVAKSAKTATRKLIGARRTLTRERP